MIAEPAVSFVKAKLRLVEAQRDNFTCARFENLEEVLDSEPLIGSKAL